MARLREDVARGDARGLVLDAYLVGVRLVVPLALRALALPTLLEWLAVITPHAGEERAHLAVARSEALAARMRVPSTCLYRAMARWAALRNADLDATFVMGVHRDAPDAGHAWVEVAGEPVGEVVDRRLIVTFRHPGTLRPPRRA